MPLNPYIQAPGSVDRELRPPGFKELGDQALAQGKQAAASLVEESLARVKGNVVAPAFNAGLIEPYNLLASGVNACGGLVGKDQLLAKQGPMTVDKVDFLSAGWLVQGVSGGLGALLPYVLAGKAAGSGMRSLGSHLELEGKAAALAKSGRLASVVGAFGYDLGRDKKEGETRLGNGMSGAAGFAVFESGNALAAGLGLPGRLLARTATGFVGGGVQALTAEAVSHGRLVSKEEFGHAAVSGMVMAHALPGTQRMLAGAADSINLGIGRGLPLDRLPERDGRFADGQNSPAFKELVAENPWARVQLDAPQSQAMGGKKVELREGAGLAELGHELVHLGQIRSAQFESQFVQAAGHLNGGNIESAWQTYRQTRLNQEQAAREGESLIRRQLSGEQSLSADMPVDIASQKVGSLTYEQHWAREFALFQKSGGAFRPVVSFHGDEHRGGADKAHHHEPVDGSSGAAKQELHRQIEALEEAKPTDAELQKRESEYQRELATELVRSLQERKHIAVFAGGAVRDEIMGKVPKDFDIATSADPEQVERIFQSLGHRVIPVGKQFGVINVVVDGREFEIATLRTDGKYTDGRRPESVQFVSSLEADAARRDLTINAMFKDPISGKVYDFFGGQSDLSDKILRAVGNPRERFAEDSLRMLRIPRFASRYGGFTVDLDTMAAIKANSIGIQSVSGERIREELRGILTSSEPVRGMQIMMNAGLMKEVLPEVYRLRGPKGRQDPEHHPEKTVWTHTKLVLRNLTGGSFERMMGGLLHDVGKPDTQKFWPDGGISNHGHDARGAEITQEIARRLRLSGQQEQVVVDMVRLHMVMHEVQNLRPGKLAALLERADVMDLIELQHADATGTLPSKTDRSQKEFLLNKLDELRQQGKLGEKPIVDGRSLLAMNLKPGPQFRTILEAARDAQREGEFTDSEGAQRWLKENVERLIEESSQSIRRAS